MAALNRIISKISMLHSVLENRAILLFGSWWNMSLIYTFCALHITKLMVIILIIKLLLIVLTGQFVLLQLHLATPTASTNHMVLNDFNAATCWFPQITGHVKLQLTAPAHQKKKWMNAKPKHVHLDPQVPAMYACAKFVTSSAVVCRMFKISMYVFVFLKCKYMQSGKM